MPILSNSKHESFAQAVAKGLSATKAYLAAGYARSNAGPNAGRLSKNEQVLKRIDELKTRVAEGVVSAEIRRRSWRVQQLQDWADDMLALRAARKKLYGKPASLTRVVANADEQAAAEAEGYYDPIIKRTPAADGTLPPEFPKSLNHTGYHLGGDTGMLVKDYRGKNAEQEIWKFDAALVEKFANVLKQAAIEEGQWTEKREHAGNLSYREIVERLNEGRARVAAAAKLSVVK